MAHCQSYAKDLFRERPSEPSALLKDKRYWDATFLRIYLDHCDEIIYNDPQTGHELAKTALALAMLIPEKRPIEWERHASAAEKQEHRELLVRSHGTVGKSYRAMARFEDAERSYRKALEVCESGPVSPATRANLDKRLAVLRSAQKRFDEALRLVGPAIEVNRDPEGDPDCLADALVTKGYILCEAERYTEGFPCFSEALALVKPRKRAPSSVERTFHAAFHNMAAVLSRGCFRDNTLRALGHIKVAKKYLAKKRDSVNKHKLTWMEGRIHVQMGMSRFAERRFLSTIPALLKLGAALEATLVALELSLIYREWGQWDDLVKLAAETYENFKKLSADTEALAALRLWVEAAKNRSLDKASILETSKLIERRIYRAAIESKQT